MKMLLYLKCPDRVFIHVVYVDAASGLIYFTRPARQPRGLYRGLCFSHTKDLNDIPMKISRRRRPIQAGFIECRFYINFGISQRQCEDSCKLRHVLYRMVPFPLNLSGH